MTRGGPATGWLLLLMAAGCHRAPPPSQFPNVQAALSRMRESQACSQGVSGEAKLDYFGDGGRVRGSVLFVTHAPDRVRFDVFSPFGATLSSLSSDGTRFALYDLREKSFLQGPANACNLQRFTRVPLPPHAFVELLRGLAPVLIHEPGAAQLAWSGGAYVIRILSKHQAEQEIRLTVPESDWTLPWQEQRVRVLEVQVRQGGIPLYQVELQGHGRVQTAPRFVDPDGIDPPIAPSGPACHAELPHRLHFVVGPTGHDVVLASQQLLHNPPLMPFVFTQTAPPGVEVRYSPCGEPSPSSSETAQRAGLQGGR